MQSYVTPSNNNIEDMCNKKYVGMNGPFQTKRDAKLFITTLIRNNPRHYTLPSRVPHATIYPTRHLAITSSGFYVMMSAYMVRDDLIVSMPFIDTGNGEKRVQILFVEYFDHNEL